MAGAELEQATLEERAYLQQRAEAALELARRPEHPDAARAHELLAGFYLDRLHRDNGEALAVRAPASC
jgi:hypothetical protein